MACRAGITTRPSERKKEWEQKYPNMYNWVLHGPFDSRTNAQAWEGAQNCEKHHGGNEPDSSSAMWYGYTFDY